MVKPVHTRVESADSHVSLTIELSPQPSPLALHYPGLFNHTRTHCFSNDYRKKKKKIPSPTQHRGQIHKLLEVTPSRWLQLLPNYA